ncbi:enoyl-[acyl-carrier-protein] reductase, mitochondrial-like [Lissotriton helveticus]
MALPWLLSLRKVDIFCSPMSGRLYSVLRSHSSAGVRSCDALVYRTRGHPREVLSMENVVLPHVHETDVRIKMLAAPINPADINMIEGTYALLPTLPAVGGNEGMGEVIEVGRNVLDLKPGDWVIPVDAGFGTWRTEAVCKASEVMLVSKDIPLLSAATIGVNPCTAYRLLMDFETLMSGDTVIQNGANSAVGQAVIQIAASMGLKTINVIRDRPNVKDLMETLHSIGADWVLTEETLNNSKMADLFRGVPKPKLALNCVGGHSAGNLLKHIECGGTMVTYGAMARKPMQLPAKHLIFDDIKIRGFWMTRWKKENKKDLRKFNTMVSLLSEMVRKGKLTAPICTPVPLHDYKVALEDLTSTNGRKYMLIMD